MIWLKITCCHPFATAVCVRSKLRESGHFFFFSEQRKVYCWAKQGEQVTHAKKIPWGLWESDINVYWLLQNIWLFKSLVAESKRLIEFSNKNSVQGHVLTLHLFTICFRREIKAVTDWAVILLLRYCILLLPHKLKTAWNVFISNTISVLVIRKMITFSSVNVWKIQ